MKTPYQLLGDEGISQLAQAFYDVMDELDSASDIRAMHGESLDSIKILLTDFLTEWMGGPPKYSDKTGSICLTEAHAPYAIGEKERDQWLDCFHQALERIDAPEQVKTMLGDPIFRVAETVRNRGA